MSAVAVIVVGLVVLLLLAVGVIAGWAVGSNDSQLEILTRRLSAEQRIDAVTRQTLSEMRRATAERFRGR